MLWLFQRRACHCRGTPTVCLLRRSDRPCPLHSQSHLHHRRQGLGLGEHRRRQWEYQGWKVTTQLTDGSAAAAGLCDHPQFGGKFNFFFSCIWDINKKYYKYTILGFAWWSIDIVSVCGNTMCLSQLSLSEEQVLKRTLSYNSYLDCR